MAMLLIILYHFLEVNAVDEDISTVLEDEKLGVGAVKPHHVTSVEKEQVGMEKR
jgi:hypothetical protein